MVKYRQKGGETMKLILDEDVVIAGLSVNIMHDNKTKKPYLVIEDDNGDTLIMEVKTYGEEG